MSGEICWIWGFTGQRGGAVKLMHERAVVAHRILVPTAIPFVFISLIRERSTLRVCDVGSLHTPDHPSARRRPGLFQQCNSLRGLLSPLSIFFPLLRLQGDSLCPAPAQSQTGIIESPVEAVRSNSQLVLPSLRSASRLQRHLRIYFRAICCPAQLE